MQIKKVDSQEFFLWSDQIERLFNESVKLNFPNFDIGNNYGKEKCNEVASYLKDGSAIVFVAYNDSELMGWAWCHEINRLGKKRLHIAEIAISKKNQNKGIGSKLMNVIDEYAFNNGYLEVDLLVTADNQSAVSFYKKLSFEFERHQMCKKVSSNHDRIR